MNRVSLVAVLLLATSLDVAWSREPQSTPKATLSSFPLSFEANQGQEPGDAEFIARGSGFSLSLGRTGAEVRIPSRDGGAPSTFGMRFNNANPAPDVDGVERLPGAVHYYTGGGRSAWKLDVPTFAKVRYNEIYPGIDLIFHGAQQSFEYDLVVHPGAEPSLVGLRIEGAKQVSVNANGNLVIETEGGVVLQGKPVAYQETANGRRTIASQYRLLADNTVKFDLGSYDPTKELVIDPVLGYGTFLGLSGPNYPRGAAADPAGNAYVIGEVSVPSPTFRQDSFITKVNASGTAIVYTVYLEHSLAWAITADAHGNAYITGTTTSASFPTRFPFQSTLNNGSDAFILKLDPTGQLAYGSYLGGSGGETGVGIGLDGDGNMYVTGQTGSWDFPTTPGAFQRNCNIPPSSTVPNPPPPSPTQICSGMFVAALSSSGASLRYGTFFAKGGSAPDALAVDPSGRAYIAGSTMDETFPTKPGSQPNGNTDVFVAGFSTSGALTYSLRLGGPGIDRGLGIAADQEGNAYVTGATWGGFQITAGAAQTQFGGVEDSFVTKVSPSGGVIYSTYLGGTTGDMGNDIEVDAGGAAYVTGSGTNPTFPTIDPIPGATISAFLTKVAPDGESFIYSTHLGGGSGLGVGLDAANNAYVAGNGPDRAFRLNPIFAPSWNTDTFLVKLEGGSGAPAAVTIENLFIEEGNAGTSVASFLIRLSRTSSSPVFVTATTANGSASAGNDYIHRSQDIVIQPGNSGAVFDVPIVGDQLDEGVETFLVNLSDAVGASVATPQAIGTILNDDAATLSFLTEDVLESHAGTEQMTFVVSMSHAKAFPVTVNVLTANSIGTATVGVDFDSKSQVVTIPAGATGAPFVVTVRGDTIIEPDETIGVSMNSASGGVEIADNVAYGIIINDDFPSPLAGLIGYVEALEVHRIIRAGLLAPLRSANRFLTDQNPRNNRLACPIVTGWIQLVDALMDRNVITDIVGNALIILGRQARFDMDC